MELHMTIFENYSNIFRKINADYDTRKKLPINSYSEFNEEIRLEKRAEEAEKNRKLALSQIDAEIKKIEKIVSDKSDEKIKLKFPLYYFPPTRPAGLTEITNAKSYLSTRRTSEKLLAEVDFAIELERWDYLSALLDEVKTNRSENLQDNKVKEEIFTKIDKLPNYKKIEENQKEITDLKEVLNSASLLKSAIIQDNIPEVKEYNIYQIQKKVGVKK